MQTSIEITVSGDYLNYLRAFGQRYYQQIKDAFGEVTSETVLRAVITKWAAREAALDKYNGEQKAKVVDPKETFVSPPPKSSKPKAEPKAAKPHDPNSPYVSKAEWNAMTKQQQAAQRAKVAAYYAAKKAGTAPAPEAPKAAAPKVRKAPKAAAPVQRLTQNSSLVTMPDEVPALTF